MATLKIEPASGGTLWVTLTRFCAEDLARLKEIPGRRWNPERKQWEFPDTPETRAALAEFVAQPLPAPAKMIAVRTPPPRPSPVRNPSTPLRSAQDSEQGRERYVAGRDKPLTLNPPHALIKQVDDELVLRGMAYGTRKSYGQHLRNYTCPCGRCKGFDWLKQKHIAPEQATREQVRAYLVELASSGRVSAAYCRGARMALIYLYETVLKHSNKVCDPSTVLRAGSTAGQKARTVARRIEPRGSGAAIQGDDQPEAQDTAGRGVFSGITRG